ncbi:Uncharacterized conserved protein, DUF2252 family [Klenkia soli]|uniref:Uncharacterized conserved protein, DUF2252 family n=1 Tax=Klenkia soli TaxID=1052260 RepID=A0A1H0FPZ9_9ACTN|nr:DUF2252 family protein [Klenkia soli]SDN96612.1 Uncharacterized conserved protein, DUF2252 family [Klenkia soli]
MRQTIREDHENRIVTRAADAQAKFDEMARSTYSFFRGSCLLFYRDMVGEDGWMPTVLTLGDVHPGNFGVMPNADDVPVFGVNDFDEAFYAPFTWDLKRGVVGFLLGAEEDGGLSASKQDRVVRAFLDGYVDATHRYAGELDVTAGQMGLADAPPIVRAVLQRSADRSRSRWLAKKYLDEAGRGFRASTKLEPLTSRVPEFQAAVHRYVEVNELVPPARAGQMRVKDVCARHGQGVASLGLQRYYVLVEGPAGDATDDLVLEFKQARRSALRGLVPPSEFELVGEAERVSHAQRVQLVGGDAFFGAVDLDGTSFMVRERSPYKDEVELTELSAAGWREYAHTCGAVLAQAHALSDEAGLVDHDVEPDVVAAMGPRELFVDDLVQFAHETADRVRRDHAHFRTDHALHAFAQVDRVYR